MVPSLTTSPIHATGDPKLCFSIQSRLKSNDHFKLSHLKGTWPSLSDDTITSGSLPMTTCFPQQIFYLGREWTNQLTAVLSLWLTRVPQRLAQGTRSIRGRSEEVSGAYISDANTINDEMAVLRSSDSIPDPIVSVSSLCYLIFRP